MESDFAAGLGFFYLACVIFSVVLAILWILVPFAIFGIKGLLRDQLAAQRHTNAILIDIAKGLRDGQWPEPKP